ncbi:hypothetical protein ACFL19_00085 [Pseudomonadota bacterium]
MKEYWNPINEITDQEDVGIITKWILRITGLVGIVVAGIVYSYPAGNPDSLVIFLLSLSLFSKAQGRGKFIQMPWRTYFWVASTVIILFPVYGFFMIDDFRKMFSIVDYGILFLSWVSIAALYGFVYKKVFFHQKFWKAAFTIYMVIVFFDYITAIITAESFSQITIGWSYLILLLVVPSYYAFGMYAFNREEVTSNSDIRQWDFLSLDAIKGFNKNGALTLIYIGLSLLVFFFTRGSGLSLWVLVMLFFWGMAWRNLSRYMNDIFKTPEESRRKRLMKD